MRLTEAAVAGENRSSHGAYCEAAKARSYPYRLRESAGGAWKLEMYPNRSQSCGRVAGAHVQGSGPKASAPDGYARFPIRLSPLIAFLGVGMIGAGKSAAILTVLNMAAALCLVACSGASGSTAWQVEQDSDPMTDVVKSTATTKLNGSNADFELTVVCAATGKAAYQFRAFEKSGTPINFPETTWLGSRGRTLSLRFDGQKPVNAFDMNQSFSNQVLLVGEEARTALTAQTVVMRATLANGVETLNYDQSATDFRNAMQGCARSAERAATSVPAKSAQRVASEITTAPPVSAPSSKATCWSPPSGPNVDDDPNRPMMADEVAEIESVTGRPYRQGDSIYGKAEDRCPA